MTVNDQFTASYNALGSQLSFQPCLAPTPTTELHRLHSDYHRLKQQYLALMTKKRFVDSVMSKVGVDEVNVEGEQRQVNELHQRRQTCTTQFGERTTHLSSINARMSAIMKRIEQERPAMMDRQTVAAQLQERSETMRREVKQWSVDERVFERPLVEEVRRDIDPLAQRRLSLEQSLRQKQSEYATIHAQSQEYERQTSNEESMLNKLSQDATDACHAAEQRVKRQKWMRDWYQLASQVMGQVAGAQVQIVERGLEVRAGGEEDGQSLAVAIVEVDQRAQIIGITNPPSPSFTARFLRTKDLGACVRALVAEMSSKQK